MAEETAPPTEPAPSGEPAAEPIPPPEEVGPADVPPPQDFSTNPESLAEQLARERTLLPESTGPSDIVPNKPNIRPPGGEAPPPVPEEAAP